MANDRQQSARRLAAVMVADVVGYSRLMEADEAGTLAALRVRRKEILDPAVKARGGRVVKLMGDGVLVEFASAVAAVEAALALQEGFARADAETPEDRRIRLRIGINLGEVTGEGGDIFGDGVNVAARLEALAEPGGIAISAKVMDEIRGRLPVTAADMGEQSLKNISRPVRVYRVSQSSAPIQQVSGKRGHDKPSIAVLPFVNMGGDSADEAFADGLTEDIITAISRSVTLAVIARTSVFGYKGRSAHIQTIASELGVDWVLEGSIRRSGNRVRVTAQLIEGSTGAHVWAEKFDGITDDIFDIQDRITRSIAATTHTTIFSSFLRANRALARIDSPAFRLAAEAGAQLFRMTPEGMHEGERLALLAIEADPQLPYAHRIRSNAFSLKLATGLAPHSTENVEQMLSLAEEALRRAPEDEWAHWNMALALGEAGRFEEAVDACSSGLAINPNASMILGDKGDYLVMLGNPEAALPLCEEALRLNPRDPIAYWWENTIATAYLILGRIAEARDLARKVSHMKPDHVRATLVWASAAGLLGLRDDAMEAVSRAVTRFPGLSVTSSIPHYIPGFRRKADSETFLNGLRKAGLPD